jgi:hypothetical protein
MQARSTKHKELPTIKASKRWQEPVPVCCKISQDTVFQNACTKLSMTCLSTCTVHLSTLHADVCNNEHLKTCMLCLCMLVQPLRCQCVHV